MNKEQCATGFIRVGRGYGTEYIFVDFFNDGKVVVTDKTGKKTEWTHGPLHLTGLHIKNEQFYKQHFSLWKSEIVSLA